MQTGGFGSSDVCECDTYLQKWVKSLPTSPDLSLPRLDQSLQSVSNFDLERHLLHMSYYAICQALHRTCFFPGKLIAADQVFYSRQICADSALAMIKLQESLRMRIVSDHHLRCLYIPLFTLEASITLALVSLLDLGNDPSVKVSDYMSWARRGHTLLLSSPSNFGPTMQASKLLSRILLKCSQIIELHTQALESGTSVDGKMDLQGILTEEGGKAKLVPWSGKSHGRADGQILQRSNSSPLLPGNVEAYPFEGSPIDRDGFELSESSYADLGLLFFDNLAGPIQTEGISGTPLSSSQNTMNSQNFEVQMDAWLETLRGIV